MILYTVISPTDIFYDFSKQEEKKKTTQQICTTDPFAYLDDAYTKAVGNLRK